MKWVKDIDSLHDFITYVYLRAPDRFPVEDFLEAHEQMTLEKAFKELSYGIELVLKDFPLANNDARLSSMLEKAYDAYTNNEIVKGAHLLQDFQNAIFKE